MSSNFPKGAELRKEIFSVKTATPDDKAKYGSLRVLVRVNGTPYTEKMAKAERTFLINQGYIDESWEVIPWGNGFALAPITYTTSEE